MRQPNSCCGFTSCRRAISETFAPGSRAWATIAIALDDLPTDHALLQQLVRDLVADNERRDGEIEKLRLIIKQLQRHQFGRRSEKLDPEQLALRLEDLEAVVGRAEGAAACGR